MPLASRTFGDLITFTRGSPGSYFDSSGVLQSAAINVPRFDYDPVTLAARGILVEIGITNRVRNNTAVGAVAGTPGTMPTNWGTFTTLTGLTREVVGTGTESGISYIDVRLSGTPSAAGQYILYPEASNSAAAALAQTWTHSSYLKLVAGSFSGLTSASIALIEYSAVPAFLAGTYAVVVPTGSGLVTQRFSATRTTNQATVAFVAPQFSFSLDGAAVDFTLRIGMPQLEQNAFPTSIVPTSTVAVTRSPDVAYTDTLSPWFNMTEGALYAKFLVASLGSPGNRVVAILGVVGGAPNRGNYININDASNDAANFLIYDDASVFQGVSTPVVTTVVNTEMQVAGAYKVDDSAMSINGAVPVTDATVTLSNTIDRLRMGASLNGGSPLSGWIQQFEYYPVRLTNADLQAITV